MIVLVGGMVELYPQVITVAHVMEKYPGLVVTRPKVFKRPHESIVGSEEFVSWSEILFGPFYNNC
ncbi:hypothetical protein QJS04_geneDACA020370 [Acorus gramineus]|uniref:Uncharacterized protein n=1 Tax=Acorus gramineus TaxID=55184 RepID=A0AAV9A352_ACOGR|nr:hypothetical protein QJS04_geneDACA020370 [Acorus gramineus]